MDERIPDQGQPNDATGDAGDATAGQTGGDTASGAVGRGGGGHGGGEVRRRLDRAPGERYRQGARGAEGSEPKPAASRARRIGIAVVVALVAALVLFALVTFDIGPGIIVLGIVGGWLVGIALAGGASPGTGDDAGWRRALTAGALAGSAPALGLLLDSLRAYALGGVLLPWEYALARFGLAVPLAVAAAAVAGALRGR